ncbi:MAG: hypothetical protein ACLU38_04965 [Dysosmobacter sp.]
MIGTERTLQQRTDSLISAKQTGNCDLSEAVKKPDGTIDYSECGGTVEDNVRRFYNANGIDATAYTGNDVPAIEALANSLKDGGSSNCCCQP